MLTELHEQVLLKICKLLQDSGKAVCWGLTGSTSFAIQGMDFEPHDIDIQTDEPTAYILGDLLKDYVVQPVSYRGNERIRSHFGKFLAEGMEIEVRGDIQKKSGEEWENSIPLRSVLDFVDWKGYKLPVLRLPYEAEAYRKLGRLEKAAAIEQFIRERYNPVRRGDRA